MTRRIDISYKTIIFITAFLILLWTLYLILDIILLLFVALILMSTLSPLVKKLERWHLPKVVSILVTFLLIIGSFVILLGLGFNPLIAQTSSLSHRLAGALNYLLQSNLIDQSIIQRELADLSANFVNTLLGVFQNVIQFVSVIVITFYLLLEREKIEGWASSLFGGRQEKVKKLIERIEDKLGAWLRGQLVLSVAVAVLVYAGLLILGVEFALPLAILAGLLEVVPVIGPIISAIPAVLIALTVSPFLALLVGGLYLAIQQVEGHVIVPQVMKRAVGLNPLLVILSISVGSRLLGIAGALLAVPIAVVIEIIIQEVLKPDKAES